MNKLKESYYDVLYNTMVKKTEAEVKASEKFYKLKEDTFENRLECAKDYLRKKIFEVLDSINLKKIYISANLGYDFGYPTKIEFNKDEDFHKTYRYVPAIISSGKLRNILKEIFVISDKYFFYESDFWAGYKDAFIAIKLDGLVETTWNKTNAREGRLTFTFNEEKPVIYGISTTAFLSLGKDIYKKLKFNVGGYVLAIKKNINEIENSIKKAEKHLETLRNKLNDAKSEYESFEDYEKLLGEIYEGDI